MAYSADISGLGADHHWKFDGDSIDAIGAVVATDTSVLYTGAAITKDATNCATLNAVGDRISIATTTTINNSAQARKAVAGWVQLSAVQQPFTRIYGEGNATDNFQFVLGFGNNLTFQAAGATTNQVQIYTDRSLVVDRVYHLCAVYEGTGYADEVRLYLDGIEQTSAIPVDRAPGVATLDTRTLAEFGDPAGTVGLNGTTLLMVSPVEIDYQHWCAWGDEADAVLTDSEVRVTLFERGALAEDTVTTGTESAMQTLIDGDGQTAVDAACVIEVEAVSGGGDFTLEMNGQDFDPLASIHIRYNGAADTLTIIDDGTTGIDADKLSAPFGGTIELFTEVTVQLTVKDASDFAVIASARVLVEADTGGPESVGTDILTGLTNGSGIATVVYNYASDQPVTGRVRKSSASTYYKTGSVVGTITSGGFDVTILLVPDE